MSGFVVISFGWLLGHSFFEQQMAKTTLPSGEYHHLDTVTFPAPPPGPLPFLKNPVYAMSLD